MLGAVPAQLRLIMWAQRAHMLSPFIRTFTRLSKAHSCLPPRTISMVLTWFVPLELSCRNCLLDLLMIPKTRLARKCAKNQGSLSNAPRNALPNHQARSHVTSPTFAMHFACAGPFQVHAYPQMITFSSLAGSGASHKALGC